MTGRGETGTRKPLDGIRVVEIGQYVAVPGAAALLTGLGAEVVKIEPLAGEATRHLGTFGRSMITSYNRGKRSVALDLGHPDGLAAARRIVEHADILLQNMRPGRLAELGLSYETAHEINPALVYVSVSAFPAQSPSASRAGFDIAAQAESGVMSITGEADGPPQRVGFSMVDSATTYAVVQAALAAHIQRLTTGVGEHVELSLLDVAVHLQAINFSEYFITGTVPTRRGNGQASVAPAADVVTTKDGHVVLSAYTQDRWAAFCRLIGRSALIDDPRFVDNPARVAHRGELREVLDEALAHLTSEECVTWLSSHGMVAAVVRDYPAVRHAPDVVAAGIIRQGLSASDSSEREEYVSAPFTFAGKRMAVDAPPPAIGEHTVAVLRDCGMSVDEIERLIAEDAARTEHSVVPTGH